ncbi:MAG: rhomboid family intramembrane serine protease [Bacteroidales bacterium]|nr:rhomboid family intramembrane serine protease [Bacteroidales bacterium]
MIEFRSNGCMNSIPPVTKNIILINFFVYIFTELRPEFMYGYFSLFYPSSQYFHWWQPVTHMFMHGGFWHIFFNMYTLFLFGAVLERMWGPKKFLLFYFVTGLGAAGLHIGVQALQVAHLQAQLAAGVPSAAAALGRLYSIPTVGASGAIYGLLVGYAMLFPDSRLTLLFPPVTLSAKWMVIIFIIIELTTGVFGRMTDIAHFAHLGGALFGWLMILYWKKKGKMYDYEQ